MQIPGTGGLFLLVIRAFRHLIDALKYGILNYIHKNFAFQQQLGPGVLYLQDLRVDTLLKGATVAVLD